MDQCPRGAGGELYLDVKDAFYNVENRPLIVGGRYGLVSYDTTPAQIISVFNNLALPEPKNNFTIGIVDDVTFTSASVEEIALAAPVCFSRLRSWRTALWELTKLGKDYR